MICNSFGDFSAFLAAKRLNAADQDQPADHVKRQRHGVEQQPVGLAAAAVNEVDPGGQQGQHARYLEAAAQHHLDTEVGEVKGQPDAGVAGELGGAVELPVRIEQQGDEGSNALILRDQGQQPACYQEQGCLHRLSRRLAPV